VNKEQLLKELRGVVKSLERMEKWAEERRDSSTRPSDKEYFSGSMHAYGGVKHILKDLLKEAED